MDHEEILDLGQAVARFMEDLFREALKVESQYSNVPVPKSLSRRLIEDCFHAVSVIRAAVRRRYSTQWPLQDYAAALTPKQTGRNELLEKKLAERFKPIFNASKDGHPVEHLPATVLDSRGLIMMMYLPGVLTEDREEDVTSTVSLLTEKDRSPVSMKTPTWRGDTGSFREATKCGMSPGLACFSPAWWGTGHTNDGLPGPSTTLKTPDGVAFIDDMKETLCLLGGILSIIHPRLYREGIRTIEKLRSATTDDVKSPEVVKQVLQSWCAPFSAMSLIVNRETILHRDVSGPRFAMDLLLTGGLYRDGRFETPGLGLNWVYNAGTVIAILGNVLHHGVKPVNGDRYCIAHFFRDSIMARFGQATPPPPMHDDIVSKHRFKNKIL